MGIIPQYAAAKVNTMVNIILICVWYNCIEKYVNTGGNAYEADVQAKVLLVV